MSFLGEFVVIDITTAMFDRWKQLCNRSRSNRCATTVFMLEYCTECV